MKTTLTVYIVMWLLVVVPLICFNIRKIVAKQPQDHSVRIRWKTLILVSVTAVLATCFLFAAYQITIQTRYEIASERFINEHCDYLLGNSTQEQFLSKTAALTTQEYQETFDQMEFGSYQSANEVRFQIGDWIIPKYYQDEGVFPPTEILDDENPVYLVYRLEADGQTSY